MRKSYCTVKHEARIEIEEKKSTFIGYCQPLADEQQANLFVSGIREKHPDATHHVYAWILGGQVKLQKYSDDGEPQGTAGIPVLDVMRKAGIEDLGLVIVRYFGGVLLGGGGLVRAYSKTASLALEKAEPVIMQLCCRYKVTVPYHDYERLKFHLSQGDFWQGETKYSLDVEMLVGAIPDKVEELIKICKDQTAGVALIEEAEPSYVPLPPPDPPLSI